MSSIAEEAGNFVLFKALDLIVALSKLTVYDASFFVFVDDMTCLDMRGTRGMSVLSISYWCWTSGNYWPSYITPGACRAARVDAGTSRVLEEIRAFDLSTQRQVPFPCQLSELRAEGQRCVSLPRITRVLLMQWLRRHFETNAHQQDPKSTLFAFQKARFLTIEHSILGLLLHRYSGGHM